MFPFEMPRYIAGIRREARKYAGFGGFFVPNATKPPSPENRPNPEVRRGQLSATAGRCCDRQKRKAKKDRRAGGQKIPHEPDSGLWPISPHPFQDHVWVEQPDPCSL